LVPADYIGSAVSDLAGDVIAADGGVAFWRLSKPTILMPVRGELRLGGARVKAEGDGIHTVVVVEKI